MINIFAIFGLIAATAPNVEAQALGAAAEGLDGANGPEPVEGQFLGRGEMEAETEAAAVGQPDVLELRVKDGAGECEDHAADGRGRGPGQESEEQGEAE